MELPVNGIDLKHHLSSVERDLITSALQSAEGVVQNARLMNPENSWVRLKEARLLFITHFVFNNMFNFGHFIASPGH